MATTTGRSTNYAIQFTTLAIASLVAAGFVFSSLVGRLIFSWISLAFAVVAFAYATGSPRLLMKRRDGSRPSFAWLVLGPYFLLAHLSIAIYHTTNRRSTAAAEIVPGVWFARRLTRREASRADIRSPAILDLAAEFARVPIHSRAYLSLPALDGTTLSASQLNTAVAWIDAHQADGAVLIHCALGHGRTGSIALAWLLAHQIVETADTGVAYLVARRGSFGMSDEQIEAAEGSRSAKPALRHDSDEPR